MIWTNMSLPSVNYRVQLCDTWADLDFERMDNPREGDKIVYRSLGEDNIPYISKTEVYSDGGWTEESGGGGSDFIVPKQTITITDSPVPIQADFSSLSGDGYLCGGYLQEEDGYLYSYFTPVYYDWTSEHALHIEMPNLGSYGASINIVEDNGTITAVVADSKTGDVVPGTYTFGVAANFLI